MTVICLSEKLKIETMILYSNEVPLYWMFFLTLAIVKECGRYC